MTILRIAVCAALVASVAMVHAAPKKPGKRSGSKKNAPRRSVSASTRQEAQEGVEQKLAKGAGIPIANVNALAPFFEQLYRQQKGESSGPLRVLHYGDSHVAADEWTADLRGHFKQVFGDGGSGYSLAGRPWKSYRRLDVRSGSSRGWHSDGLVGRTGDGAYGMGGVSMSSKAARESVYIVAEAPQFELFYLRQPGGGTVQVYDNGVPIDRISTAGERGPGYYRYDAEEGSHKLEARTLDRAPVRLFGWVAERNQGVTYEALGINGADVPLLLKWNEEVLRSNLQHRSPALIVLSYGTNEAGQKGWTLEKYRETFASLIRRFRQAAPSAAILVIGPPDRAVRVRGKEWAPLENLDLIVEAQREAAVAEDCAFWDQRAKMGGKGSMREWMLAGMAQTDHVHLTLPGYRMIGDVVFRDLMSEYGTFVKGREALARTAADGAPGPDTSR